MVLDGRRVVGVAILEALKPGCMSVPALAARLGLPPREAHEQARTAAREGLARWEIRAGVGGYSLTEAGWAALERERRRGRR